MNSMRQNSRKRGQSLTEYGLIIALVGTLCIVALQGMGGSISKFIANIAPSIGNVNTNAGG